MALVVDISITEGGRLLKLWTLEIRRRQPEPELLRADYDVFLYEPDGLRTNVQTEVSDFLRERGAIELVRAAVNEVRAVQRAREFHEAERDRVDWEVTS